MRGIDERLACWGDSIYGQLGTGATFENGPFAASAVTILPPEADPIFAALTHRSACTLLRDGSIRCWGSNLDGQLGIGELGGPEDSLNETGCCYVSDTVTPALPDGATFIDLRAGGAPWANEFYVALTDTGDVYCWGTGTTTPTLKLSNISQIAVGGYFGCALDKEGSVACWGNPWGIGESNRVCELAVEPMAGLPENRVRMVAAGNLAGFAVDQDEHIYAWGENRWGALGPGFIPNVNYYPAREMNWQFPAPVMHLTGTHNAACALLTNGEVYCWGHKGMQGNGTPVEGFAVDSIPRRATIDDVVELEADHIAFTAIDQAGHVYRWNGFVNLLVPTEVTLP